MILEGGGNSHHFSFGWDLDVVRLNLFVEKY